MSAGATRRSISVAARTAAAAMLLTGSVTAAVAAQDDAADLIIVGGTVLTMDADASTADGVAVRDGRILAVGDEATMRSLAGSDTRVIELNGRTLTPGFLAPHDHFWGAGTVAVHYVDVNSPPIGRMRTIDQIVDALRARAAQLPAGTWVVGRGYDDTLLREGRHPTRADLDSASTDHPIWITHVSGHLGVANSPALELAGVDRTTPQPSGGHIRIDPETGKPNGVFEESGSLITRHIPAFTESQRLAAIEWAAAEYVSRGVTTTVIAGNSSRQKIADLIVANDAGVMRGLRVITMASRATRSAEATRARLATIDPERLRLGAIKIIQDGSIQGFTGYLSEPYHTPFNDDPDYRGYPRRDRDGLEFLVVRAHCEGYQVAVHANGDAAIDDVLVAYDTAQARCPRSDARHRIEHAQMTRADQAAEMHRLGITPSFFVGHVFYWGDRHRDIFLGPDRAAAISPLRTATRAGVRWTVHDDTPVTPVNPLQLVWGAVNRRTTSGKVLGSDETVPPLDALRAVTSTAAWQNFAEESRGSIEPGKLADFVILSANPLTVDPQTIRDIDVLETIVGGVSVFKATAGDSDTAR
jgi:predicted amidohydrolase YtcJ